MVSVVEAPRGRELGGEPGAPLAPGDPGLDAGGVRGCFDAAHDGLAVQAAEHQRIIGVLEIAHVHGGHLLVGCRAADRQEEAATVRRSCARPAQRSWPTASRAMPSVVRGDTLMVAGGTGNAGVTVRCRDGRAGYPDGGSRGLRH